MKKCYLVQSLRNRGCWMLRPSRVLFLLAALFITVIGISVASVSPLTAAPPIDVDILGRHLNPDLHLVREWRVGECRRAPEKWNEVRNGVNYTCFKQVCCVAPRCAGGPVLPDRLTTTNRCFPCVPGSPGCGSGGTVIPRPCPPGSTRPGC